MRFKSEKMKITYCILCLCLVCYSLLMEAQDFIWAKQIGGTTLESGNSIATDSSGNVYTTGWFNGTTDFDPGTGTFPLTSAGTSDIYIAKYDSLGSLLWAKRIGGNSLDQGFATACDSSGNIFFTGTFTGTVDFDPGSGSTFLYAGSVSRVFICSFDASGNFRWVKQIYGSNGTSVKSMCLSSSGNVYITGSFLGLLTPSDIDSRGDADIFTACLDNAGNYVWIKTQGGTGFESGYGIAVDPTGNVYITGNFDNTANFDTGYGTYNLTPEGDKDVFISKLSPAGGFEWAKKVGGTESDHGSSIVIDKYGTVILTGFFSGFVDFNPGTGSAYLLSKNGSIDVFVLKLDAMGNYVWVKHFSGSGYEIGSSVTTNSSGDLFITGSFVDTVDFDSGPGLATLTSFGDKDIFVTKLDAYGNFLWVAQAGGTSPDAGYSVTADTYGNVYVTGIFEGSADFDPGTGLYPLTAAGNMDIFVLKLSSNSVLHSENNSFRKNRVYPNPSQGNITIEVDECITGTDITIRNLYGQVVYQRNHKGPSPYYLTFEGSPGMYFLEMTGKTGRVVTTIIKER